MTHLRAVVGLMGLMVIPRKAEVFKIKDNGELVPLEAEWTHSQKLEESSRKSEKENPFAQFAFTIDKLLVETDAFPKAKRIK